VSSEETGPERIGRRVREARLAQGLTQEEVAERWAKWEGLKKPYKFTKVWNIEAGRRARIGDDELQALAMVLGRPLSYFTTPD